VTLEPIALWARACEEARLRVDLGIESGDLVGEQLIGGAEGGERGARVTAEVGSVQRAGACGRDRRPFPALPGCGLVRAGQPDFRLLRLDGRDAGARRSLQVERRPRLGREDIGGEALKLGDRAVTAARERRELQVRRPVATGRAARLLAGLRPALGRARVRNERLDGLPGGDIVRVRLGVGREPGGESASGRAAAAGVPMVST
jgi:hypothetical protein